MGHPTNPHRKHGSFWVILKRATATGALPENRSRPCSTLLLDAERYTREELAAAYRARWNAELDLRSIKQVMQMDVLRCKTPAGVRKEVWMHMLAYNLVRKLMAQAAATVNRSPREISFKGTLQTLLSFAPCGWSCSRENW